MYRYEKYLRPDRGVFPLSELASRSAEAFGDLPVMRRHTGSGYEEISYNQFADRVHAIARWLLDRGITKNDRVALLGENRPEWGMVYLAVQAAGAVIVPVDSMMPASGIRHIIADSDSRILFCSEKFRRSIEEMAVIPSLETIVCMDEGDGKRITLAETIEHGEASDTELPLRELDELAAIIYTSGTTGHSKGVMLTQNNLMSNVAAACRILPLGTSDTYLSVLPMHHTYECTNGFLLPIYCGCSITYARSLKSTELLEDMKNTGVTIMVAVPLLYEKMYEGMTRKLAKLEGAKKTVLSVLLGLSKFGWSAFGKRWGKSLLRSLRKTAGMDSVIFFISGGGPLDPRVADFFTYIGLTMLQGYGLTETSPLTHVNLPGLADNVTVGPPIIEVEQKIDEPNEEGIGEIMLRGPNVFQGYYKNEEATKAVLSDDGWFRTGDLGRITPEGFLRITGRKKNILVTAGGKNVYPEEIEHFLNRSQFISESLVLGVARESGFGDEVAALIAPDYEQIDLYFEELGKKADDEQVHALIKAEIGEAQKHLEDFKRVRRFRIMEEEFQKTSTKKIKRFLYSGDMVTVNGRAV